MATKNQYLKKAGELVEYTPETIRELQICSTDPIYFIENYCKITHPTDGLVPFNLYDFQRDMVNAFHENRLNIVCASRQVGKSQTSCAFILWYVSFHSHKNVLIASNKASGAKEMLSRISEMYENLPKFLKPGIDPTNWNKLSIAFDNNSKIISEATTMNSGRGMAISLLFCDEYGFVSPNIAESFWTSISPTLSTGGKCIIASTPNGDDNLFAELWRGAETRSNGFIPTFVKWDTVPGRDEEFRSKEIAKIGLTKFQQEYECLRGDTLITVIDEFNNEKILTMQELYDENDIDAAFKPNNKCYRIKTPNGFETFEGISLNGVKTTNKITFTDGSEIIGTPDHRLFTMDSEITISAIKPGDVLTGIQDKTVADVSHYGDTAVYDIIEVPSHTFYANGITSHNCHFISSDPLLFSSIGLSNYRVDPMPTPDARGIVFFEEINPASTYIIAIDPATGTGSDFTVMVMYSFPELKQVAEFRTNTVSSPAVYHVLKYLLKFLQSKRVTTAYWSLENNGVGEGIISLYEADENPVDFGELVSESGRRRIGFTTGKNKGKTCMSFKNLFESGKIKVRSANTISEMKNYIRKNGSYAARTGSTDDTISAHLILIRILEEIVSYEDKAYDIMYRDEFINEFDDEQWEEPLPFITSNSRPVTDNDLFAHLDMW